MILTAYEILLFDQNDKTWYNCAHRRSNSWILLGPISLFCWCKQFVDTKEWEKEKHLTYFMFQNLLHQNSVQIVQFFSERLPALKQLKRKLNNLYGPAPMLTQKFKKE